MSHPLTVTRFHQMKESRDRITMLTAYDASFASAMDRAGVEIILVGDSVGMVVQGRTTTVGVTVEELAYHTRCVSRGVDRSFILGDLPFGSYSNASDAMASAITLMQAGAAMVKLEGAGPMVEMVEFMTERGVSVCGHVGLTPQSVNQLGGFRVQGRDHKAAKKVLDDGLALQHAGAQMLVVECVPAELGEELAVALEIPVIGIGAGAACDGQVLVMHDMLGLGSRLPKFVRNFMAEGSTIEAAFAEFVADVKSGRFPAAEHQY